MPRNRMTAGLQALVCTLIVGLAVPLDVSAEGEPPSDSSTDALPTPEALSALVAERCGSLIHYEWDVLGTAVGAAWRSDYARCAVDAVVAAGFLTPLGNHCDASARRGNQNLSEADAVIEIGICGGALLVEQGLGHQYSALIEACVVVNHNEPGECPFADLIDPVGIPATAESQDGEICLFGKTIVEADEADGPPPVCEDPLGIVKALLCGYGVCLDEFVDATHENTKFAAAVPDVDVCGGATVKGEVDASAEGMVFSIGVFTWWKVDARASASVDVTWDQKCDAEANLQGLATGGLFRRLVIEREGEQGTVCKYDGIIDMNCGSEPGEQWTEHVVGTLDGAYDDANPDVGLPVATMLIETKAGGEWLNVGDGSLYGIHLLDAASDVLEGSDTFLAHYTEADATFLFGVLDEAEETIGLQ